jgi:hypothetical protein
MSKLLSQLVGVQDQLFAVMVQQLESACGNPSVDIRISTEIRAKVLAHIRSLGLDPDDTTGQELYGALLGLVELHDRFLVERIGGSNPGDVADLLPRIKKLIDTINIPKSVWVLKHSVAKKIIKSYPPKNVMKQLGYRSVDSMLKRESIDELFVGIRFMESESWQEKLLSKYSKLNPSDFENREVEVLLLDGKKWGGKAFTYAKSHKHNITNLKEMGVVAILPLPVSNMPGITIVLIPRILYYINEVRTYSTYFKHHQVKNEFGATLVKTLLEDPSRHVTVAGQHLHWRVVHHFYGQESVSHPEFFEPHILPEDLFWRKAEQILFRIEPALHFWHEVDFVGKIFDDKPVSFNLMDVATNFINKTPYERRYFYHMKESLWNELFIRYLDYPALRNQVRMQIDYQSDNQFI